jgi:hypothetical protein
LGRGGVSWEGIAKCWAFSIDLGSKINAYLVDKGVRDSKESLSSLFNSVVITKWIQIFLYILYELKG